MSRFYDIEHVASGIAINPFISPEKKLSKLVALYKSYFNVTEDKRQPRKTLLANAKVLTLAKTSKGQPDYMETFENEAEKLFEENYKNMKACLEVVLSNKRFDIYKADEDDMKFVDFVALAYNKTISPGVKLPDYYQFCLGLSTLDNQRHSSFEEEIER